MLQVNMHEAKTNLSKLAKKAWNGERVVIALAGKPFIELLPHRQERKTRKPGNRKETLVIDPCLFERMQTQPKDEDPSK